MTRDELILRTRQLIAEGERLDAKPSLAALQTWLQLSDDLLATAWGTMDRYHLSWLMVGKPKGIVRGREMTPGEEAAYVREVAGQKNAALRMSLDAIERQGMPFRGETEGLGPGQGMGEVPVAGTTASEALAIAGDGAAAAQPEAPPAHGANAVDAPPTAGGAPGPAGPEAPHPTAEPGVPHRAAEPGLSSEPVAVRHAHLAQGSRRSIPLDPELQARLDAARRAASEHNAHGERRAPRPERLQR